MSDAEFVTVTVASDHVALVEFSRPPNNFFSPQMIRELADAFLAIDADDGVRASVLCSTGTVFCAGADNSQTEAGSAEPAEPAERSESASALYREAIRLFTNAKPVVAAVQGAAVGGGLGLAMFPDFRVAAPEARFVGNFSRLGFHHGFGLTETLPPVVGQQFAMEMLFTGRRIKGEAALQHGLADRLVPLKEVRSDAVALAVEIAQSAPLAVTSIRATFRSGLAQRVEAALQQEAIEQSRLRQTQDYTEGVRAMADRRLPEFHGR